MSSARHLISPNLMKKSSTAAKTSVDTLHELETLPSYVAPVCAKSSIPKEDIIAALAGKTNT